MKAKTLFDDEIYPNLKVYLTENSIYSPTTTKIYVEESKVFPLVVVKFSNETNQYNNLSYEGEDTYPFRIDINVYSNDKTINSNKVSKRTICDEVCDNIETYFLNNYKVSLRRQNDVENIDMSIHRNLIRINGILDTKFGENNLVIYPN